jgi:hypothetical protein
MKMPEARRAARFLAMAAVGLLLAALLFVLGWALCAARTCRSRDFKASGSTEFLGSFISGRKGRGWSMVNFAWGLFANSVSPTGTCATATASAYTTRSETGLCQSAPPSRLRRSTRPTGLGQLGHLVVVTTRRYVSGPGVPSSAQISQRGLAKS